MRGLTLFLLVFLLAPACTPGFQSPSQVQDLRVLAVSAEPPEALADLDGGTVPAVQVTVLVADPAPRAPVDATASICFPSDNLICGAARLDLPGTRSPGPGEIGFTVNAPATLIVGALQDDRLKGLGGVRVQFNATVADGDPYGPVTAEKVLLYSTSDAPNHSPRIVSLEITRAGGAVEQLAPGGTLNLAVGEQVGVRPLPGAGEQGAETYSTVDLKGNHVVLAEQLNYSVFTTLGAEWDKDSADEPLVKEPPDPPPPFGIVRLRATAATNGTLWVVVRDGRGGISWVTASWIAG